MKNEESRRKPILQSLQQDFARRENTLQSLQGLSRAAKTLCNRCRAFRAPREHFAIAAKPFARRENALQSLQQDFARRENAMQSLQSLFVRREMPSQNGRNQTGNSSFFILNSSLKN